MWENIKKILAKTKGTCIIIEDGQPAYVVTPFNDYQQDLDGAGVSKSTNKSSSEQELLEKINQDIIDWKTKQEVENPEIDLSEAEEAGELKIENLTF
ncbi:MAG: hypothetical protein UU87_C0003G0166 [Parcubacteria group bacterium GW2011_GWA2_42_11]|nr:MAG: hypothetical protein UU87_C0003G0166 [Parcubacteria group bacterium GW2011_GWA2_42_11]KKT76496.1 MAG: hypothetical protein UW72_C0005G0064 [Parcubacteria group bacterium GW2011_GWF2_44_7]